MARRLQWPCRLIDFAWNWQATPHPDDRRLSDRFQRAVGRFWGWAYRIQEFLAFGNGRWHTLTCPYCRGMVRYARDLEAGDG